MCKSIIHKPAQGPVIGGQTETYSKSLVSLFVVVKEEVPFVSPLPAPWVLSCVLVAVSEVIAPLFPVFIIVKPAFLVGLLTLGNCCADSRFVDLDIQGALVAIGSPGVIVGGLIGIGAPGALTLVIISS